MVSSDRTEQRHTIVLKGRRSSIWTKIEPRLEVLRKKVRAIRFLSNLGILKERKKRKEKWKIRREKMKWRIG